MHRLINRHASHLHIHQDVLMDYMPMLRRAGVGAFRLMKDDPPFREVAVPLEPARVNRIKWSAGIAHVMGSHADIVFDLGGDRYVSGIRLKYVYSEAPWIRVYWKQSVQEDFHVDQSWTYVPTGDRANWTRGTWLRVTDPETTMTVWVCETLHQLRIQLRRPGILKISELALLVPDSD